MSLSKIISIPGQSGLFKMVAQMRNGGFVVESLSDKRRIPVSSTQRIIMLEDISVYTMEDDMPLKEVFRRMKEKDAVCSKLTAKSDPALLKSTLKDVIPEFDEERVHASDIKKMFSWYNLLRDIIGTEPEEEETAQEVEEVKAEATEEKPKKAKAAKAKSDEEAPAAEKKAKKAKSDDAPAAEKKPKAPRKTTKKEA